MKPVDQTKFGVPEGNCTAACVASILEIPLDSIPCGYVGDGSGWNESGDWFAKLNEILGRFGVGLCGVAIHPGCNLEIPPGIFVLLGGMGPRGFQHCCVGAVVDGMLKVVHDPHPSRAGLVSIEYVDFIVYKAGEEKREESE